jgi:hypothetical protein
MSGPQAKPFKGRLGFDANNDKVVNVADPSQAQDAVNQRYFIANNTTPTFDSTRSYPAGFIVEYSDRLYKAKASIGQGSFDLEKWTEIHAFGRWLRVTANYAAEPGDNLVVSTATASVTVTLPLPAEDGDIVTILDEGSAKTNPIILNAGTNTINGSGSTYNINSQDIVQLIYVGGTWKVFREEKSTFQYITANTTVAPNSFNLVQTTAARTVTLPPAPIAGQWVTVADANSMASNYPITIQGNGKNINGAGSYVVKRYSEQVTMVFDGTEWKAVSNAISRIVETLTPVVGQTVSVGLDATNKAMTLPATGLVNGDWVEVVTTFDDELATGSLVVTAGSQTFRIKRRGRTLFLYKGTWSIIALEDGGISAPAINTGSMAKNSLVVLNGSASNTIYLPTGDSLQVGDYVTAKINSASGRVLVSVQNTSTDLIDAGTTATFPVGDNGVMVTFVYRGYNGSKYVWETISHGSAYLKKSENLSDVPDKAAARTALDVFSKDESNSNFLGINAKAKDSDKADNADKLDGLDSTDFIRVKNGVTTAVDANTTTETRFTTNVNTPNTSEMWQVVMFVDQASGDKCQIAMAKASTKIAYRAYSGTTWTAWTYLDQAANSATATKLATARTIALAGDATGSATFDGSANTNIAVTEVMASGIKAVATTSVSTLPEQYTKFASIAIPGEFHDFRINFTGLPTKGVTGPYAIGVPFSVDLRIRGGFPTLTFDSVSGGIEVGSVVNGSVVELYVKTPLAGTVISFHEIARNASIPISFTWLSTQTQTGTIPANYVAGLNRIPYSSVYHPSADKWTTPRKITFTGGLQGEVTIDGSSDVSLDTTINTGATQFEISNVNGLQTALDDKLSTTGKAADADKLDGVDSLDYRKAIAATNAAEDPNTTVKELILTNHANTPDSGTSYWYVETTFYQSRATSSNRVQFATKYNGGAGIQFRQYYGGAWGTWNAVSAIIDGATYNINISGTSAEATKAVALKTPRTINGVNFDGSGNIVVEDSTKLPTAGGVMTGPIVRSPVTNYKMIDNPLNYTSDIATVTGTLKITLPVGLNTSMLKLKVHLFNYTAGSSAIELDLAGYVYSSGWINTSAFTNGADLTKLGASVRFGYDGTKACILIGTTATAWSYPKLAVTDVMVGYSGAGSAEWNGAWGVEFVTAETGITIHQTVAYDSNFARVNQANTWSVRQIVSLNAGTAPIYSAGQLEINSGGTNPVVLGFHRPGSTACSLVHSSDGLILTDTTYASRARFEAGALVGTSLTVNGDATATSLTVGGVSFSGSTYSFNSWLRTTGAVGWYSTTYGGGIHMTDTTWIRTYGSKAFYVANEIAATGNITAYYSDGRLKENLKQIENARDTVLSWTGYTYNANVVAQSFGYDPSKKEIGLIAQDVQKTTPEAVEQAPFDRTSVAGKSLTGKHYLTLKYERLVPVMVEAYREHDNMIVSQAEEIQTLKEQVKMLMEELQRLKG